MHGRVAQAAFQSWETTALKNHVTRLIFERRLSWGWDSSVHANTSVGEHPPCITKGPIGTLTAQIDARLLIHPEARK